MSYSFWWHQSTDARRNASGGQEIGSWPAMVARAEPKRGNRVVARFWRWLRNLSGVRS